MVSLTSVRDNTFSGKVIGTPAVCLISETVSNNGDFIIRHPPSRPDRLFSEKLLAWWKIGACSPPYLSLACTHLDGILAFPQQERELSFSTV